MPVDAGTEAGEPKSLSPEQIDALVTERPERDEIAREAQHKAWRERDRAERRAIPPSDRFQLERIAWWLLGLIGVVKPTADEIARACDRTEERAIDAEKVIDAMLAASARIANMALGGRS